MFCGDFDEPGAIARDADVCAGPGDVWWQIGRAFTAAASGDVGAFPAQASDDGSADAAAAAGDDGALSLKRHACATMTWRMAV